MKNRLSYFYNSFFAIVLGFAGFTLASQKISHLFALGDWYLYFMYFTVLLAVAIFGTYSLKMLRHPEAFRQDVVHPIRVNFFPIIPKVFLIFSIIFLPLQLEVARVLWWIGAALQIYFSFYNISQWISREDLEYHHLNPAWFIPVVGNVIAPIAGVKLGYIQLSWFFFSIGIFMWLVLFSIVINRILFHKPIVSKLLPSLFILFAPPSIAFISYTKLVGQVENFGLVLYYFSLFLAGLVFLQCKKFAKIEFSLAWWAYSFPLAALTLSTLLFYESTHFLFIKSLLWFFYSLLSFFIVLLFIFTIRAIGKKSLCQPE